MVDRTGGQLYTIEGFAAAMILVVTAWIVVGTTSVYTPGDSHISDMQLEQMGTDVLVMMDLPDNATYNSTTVRNNRWGKSAIQTYIENTDGAGPTLFNTMFLAYCNNKTDGTIDNIQYTAWVYYRDNSDDSTKNYLFNRSRQLTQGDHAVRVSHWVLIDNNGGTSRTPSNTDVLNHRPQAVLLEVLLWRG